MVDRTYCTRSFAAGLLHRDRIHGRSVYLYPLLDSVSIFDPVHIETITVGPYESNCYIVWGDSSEALVIDPGADADRILQVIADNKLKIVAYPLTHGHMDHIGALEPVYNEHPAPIALHPEDTRWAFHPANQMPPYYVLPEKPPPIDRAYEDDQKWSDAGLNYEVIFTPGHTPGGVSLYFPEEKTLFSGDTLFQGSIGRTDLAGGDMPTLEKSLARLAEMPVDTRVFPGHGPETTIGIEKDTNYYLLNLS